MAEGHVRKRGAKWAAVFDEPGPDGTRRQRWLSGYATKREAQRALRDALSSIDKGSYVRPNRLTVAVLLSDHWLPTVDQRPNTVRSYTFVAETWIIPHIGGVELAHLTPAVVQRLRKALETQGSRGRPLSPRSVAYSLKILRMALAYGVEHALVTHNPAAKVKAPTVSRPELATWNDEQLAVFVRATADDRLAALWRIYAVTSCRRGEALAARWDDIDLDAGWWLIRASLNTVVGGSELGPVKGGKARRIALDPGTVEALRSHRRRQLEERVALGGWPGHGFVFTREDGSPLPPAWVSREFHALAAAADLPRIRLHDVRHAAISAALRNRVDVKVVSTRAGHASVSFTLDVYRSVLPEDEGAAAARMGAIVDGTKS